MKREFSAVLLLNLKERIPVPGPAKSGSTDKRKPGSISIRKSTGKNNGHAAQR